MSVPQLWDQVLWSQEQDHYQWWVTKSDLRTVKSFYYRTHIIGYWIGTKMGYFIKLLILKECIQIWWDWYNHWQKKYEMSVLPHHKITYQYRILDFMKHHHLTGLHFPVLTNDSHGPQNSLTNHSSLNHCCLYLSFSNSGPVMCYWGLNKSEDVSLHQGDYSNRSISQRSFGGSPQTPWNPGFFLPSIIDLSWSLTTLKKMSVL